MTTIAADGKIIACDSQITVDVGDTRFKTFGHKYRMVKTPHGMSLVLVTGDYRALDRVLPDIEAGKPIKRKRYEGEAHIVVVTPGKIKQYYSDGGVADDLEFACGSGDVIATTILELKGTAMQAVATAVKLDLLSGGPVRGWRIKDLSEVAAVAEVPTLSRCPTRKG